MDTQETLDPAFREAQADPDTTRDDRTSDETPDLGEQHGDSGTDKRLADKDRYIKELEAKVKTKESKPSKQAVSESEMLWLIKNATVLDVVNDEYQAYRAKGYDRDDALYLAKRDRKMIGGTSEAQQQAANSGLSGVVHRESEDESKYEPTEQQKRLGITKEMKQRFYAEIEGERK